MTTGLKNTEISQLRALFGTVLLRGLLERDDEWVASDDFIRVCEFAGLGDKQIDQLSDMYFAHQLDMRRISNAVYGMTTLRLRDGEAAD